MLAVGHVELMIVIAISFAIQIAGLVIQESDKIRQLFPL